MHIGSVKIKNFTVFAPLAGITNLPFRLLAKAAGCGLVYSEMISANGLTHGSLKTIKLMDSTDLEKPLSVQMFGAEPIILADAAQIIESLGADILDINFGCSVKKIVKTGSGAALMKNLKKAEQLLNTVRKAIKIPLTIKIRSGWDHSGDQAIAIAKIAENCGVNAIAVHPRTATQGFKGKADWSVIKAVKKEISIPVIGNGDVQSPYDALRMKKETDCNYVMIGRAAMRNPWIFREIIELSENQKYSPSTQEERIDTMTEYLKTSVQHLGERTACFILRSRLPLFVKGMRNAVKFRESLRHITSENETLALISEYKRCTLKHEKIFGSMDN